MLLGERSGKLTIETIGKGVQHLCYTIPIISAFLSPINAGICVLNLASIFWVKLYRVTDILSYYFSLCMHAQAGFCDVRVCGLTLIIIITDE